MQTRKSQILRWQALAGLAMLLACGAVQAQIARNGWNGYAHDPQHSGLATVAAQPLSRIRWSAPVDRSLPINNQSELFIHYGSPSITDRNTVLIPVRMDGGGFQIEARRGRDGRPLWILPTDYLLPPHNWIPSCAPALSQSQRYYVPGAGGTILFCPSPNSAVQKPLRLAYYGLANYKAHPDAFQEFVYINTPITADERDVLYFGVHVTDSDKLKTLTGLTLKSGLVRLTRTGQARWVAASVAANDDGITKVVHNCAPALSLNGKTLYVAVNNGNGSNFGAGYLLALNSVALNTVGKIRLKDPKSGNDALVPEDGTASPTVGPDGDVYFGVLENPFPANHDRGWLLHYDAGLTQQKTPGAFGWDDTASVVPSGMVASYHGSSSYLVMCKYNNYAGVGGDGVNRIAVLDPNATDTDPITGATVMKEVVSAAGLTPDRDFPNLPHAVREWCINTAAVDPISRCILANCEDGVLYRWDMATNTLLQSIRLTSGIGEAYTPTLIGPDGTVYAINNGTLFAVGR